MLSPANLATAGHADAETMKRLQDRDPEALAEIYDRYGRIAYSSVLRMVRDREIAQDLVQETFLHVWNGAPGFDTRRGALLPWLLSIARHRAIDYLRSASGRERNVQWSDTNHSSLLLPWRGAMPGAATLFTDTEREIVASDNARAVRATLLKLSSRQRQVIELTFFEGLTQAEIAERLGQPLGTVKSWVRSALRKLREEVGHSRAAGQVV